jgi:hypothetical protein
LFYVKWSPYYAKGFLAAQNHSIGGSIVSGNLPASPAVGSQAGLDYWLAYMKAIWQALLLGLALGAGLETALPRAPALYRHKRSAARDGLRYTLDDVYVLLRSGHGRLDRERSR